MEIRNGQVATSIVAREKDARYRECLLECGRAGGPGDLATPSLVNPCRTP